MRCPIDNEDLVISERNGVEIDYCPRCRGVWLDRGELDKIIDRSSYAPEQSSRRAPPERQTDRGRSDDHYKKRKKRSSFLEEIFDF